MGPIRKGEEVFSVRSLRYFYANCAEIRFTRTCRPQLVIRDFAQGARETSDSVHAQEPMWMRLSLYSRGIKSIPRPWRSNQAVSGADTTGVSEKITPGDLEGKDLKVGEFILLKTRNSFNDRFDPDYVFLDTAGAEYLVKQGVRGVGIDALSIERGQPGHPTHRVILREGIVIIEGLRLAEVSEGDYLLIAAPLKIVGAEASPARVILVKGQLGA